MICVHPANRVRSKQLKKYLKSIGYHWENGDTINPKYNTYKGFKNQTVYKVFDDKSLIVVHKKNVKEPVYTQRGFIRAAYFNRLDSVVHCPTIKDNERFIKTIDKELSREFEYKFYRDKVKGLMCYKILEDGLVSASWEYYNKHNYNIVNFKLLKTIAKLNDMDIGEYIWTV